MTLTVQSFINQAVKLGENSDKAFTVDTASGKVGESTVGFWGRRGTDFKTANDVSWEAFRTALASTFGEASLPPELAGQLGRGKPLTARSVMQISVKAQAAAGAENAPANTAPPAGFTIGLRGLRENAGFIAPQGADALAAPPSPEYAADTTPTGLSGLRNGTLFNRNETSIEDLTRLESDALKKGDAIGTIQGLHVPENAGSKMYIFQGIKDKGVEPGFIVTRNWLPSHENALLGEAGEDNPLFRSGVEQAGRTLAGIIGGEDKTEAAVMLILIADSLADRDAAARITTALAEPAPDHAALFGEIPEADVQAFSRDTLRNPAAYRHDDFARDARMHIRSTEREFTDKHVIKLDYNESDRSAGTRSLRLPQRIKEQKGSFFQFFRRSTVAEANRGAVAEALANDITRAIGIPAQELKLIQGSYQDGTAKLMLDSTFIKGRSGEPYRDFDHFIRDGYLDRDLLRTSGHSGTIRELGKCKAAFLLLGDRDAVGSKGQNKGFVGGSFAAIDPGHSLEGSRVTLHDDFSFDYRVGNIITGKFRSGFQNFSVFDDSPLSEKMAGWADIMNAVDDGDIGRLFDSYAGQFDGNKAASGLDFTRQIGGMRKEFMTRFEAMRATLQPRLDIYNGESGPRLLDTLENVEKLFSETSGTSPNGTVTLQHLRVADRVAVDMTRDGDGGVTLTLRKAKDARAADQTLARFLAGTVGNEFADWTIRNGSLKIPATQVDAFMELFTEKNIRGFKQS